MFTSKYKAARLASAVIVAVLAPMLQGCLENDIPYPHIQANFLSVTVDNQSRPAAIDSTTCTLTVYLDEAADIYNVRFTDIRLTPGAQLLDSAQFVSGIDLSAPVEATLHLYYDYGWTVTAIQSIERYFTVAGQIGKSEIDPSAHTVTAFVPESMPVTAIEVRSIKLGGTGAVMNPDLSGQKVDFSSPVKVAVSEFGRTVEWTITVQQTEVPVEITAVDAWSEVAWVYAAAQEGKQVGFEYRHPDDSFWASAPADWVEVTGGSYTLCLRHLDPQGSYEVRASSGDYLTEPTGFTTGSTPQMPNSTFTDWWLDGKVWCPWTEGASPYWGTGNKGATTLGNSNTVPLSDPASLTGYQGAQLESRFVGISILGKLAAGNLFTGDYVRTEGTNGVLAFGREFIERPTMLRARFKYTDVPISHTSSALAYMKGQPDTCTVWCALADWDQPFEIRTNPSNRQLFNPEDPHVIAYGHVQYGESIEDYITVDIPLDYRSTSRVPRYLVVVGSASKYGDYFTGGNGSVLYIDRFELLYDY